MWIYLSNFYQIYWPQSTAPKLFLPPSHIGPRSLHRPASCTHPTAESSRSITASGLVLVFSSRPQPNARKVFFALSDLPDSLSRIGICTWYLGLVNFVYEGGFAPPRLPRPRLVPLIVSSIYSVKVARRSWRPGKIFEVGSSLHYLFIYLISCCTFSYRETTSIHHSFSFACVLRINFYNTLKRSFLVQIDI